jgi:hypothetical protein
MKQGILMEETTNATDASETQTSESTATETVKPQDESTETVEGTTKEPSIKDLQDQVKRLEQALNKANKDAKDQRFKTQELSQQAKELAELKQRIESEKLSEQEKQELARKTLEKQLADLQKKYSDDLLKKQERLNETELRAQAAHLGFIDLADATRLIDTADLEHDEDGVPTNAREVLEKLLKAKPYLAKSSGKPTPTSGGATNPPRSATTTQGTAESYIERISQGKLSDAEYQVLPASIKHQIQEGLKRSSHKK